MVSAKYFAFDFQLLAYLFFVVSTHYSLYTRYLLLCSIFYLLVMTENVCRNIRNRTNTLTYVAEPEAVARFLDRHFPALDLGYIFRGRKDGSDVRYRGWEEITRLLREFQASRWSASRSLTSPSPDRLPCARHQQVQPP
ncbi:hypothetical protein OBBRIDRAFT_387857 [Obba rivulosa]|uniref:Uncharacterized protein n=1 Tax=Obba rivulosa TaxID=1052685 RepID=A0A8E2DLW9_9APHY|nr:hypothetical protein OBBRIDRAFT_387857 [Obba rivulosa]